MDNKKHNVFLKKELQKVIEDTIEIAKLRTWNKIPADCQFVLTEIKFDSDFLKQRKDYQKETRKKKLCDLDEIISKLSVFYEDIYDITIVIFQVKKEYNIIDIRYFLKTSFDKDYYEEIKNREPIFYVQLPIPSYLDPCLNELENKKFDINWQFHPIRYKWNMFISKIKTKKYNWKKMRKKKLNI